MKHRGRHIWVRTPQEDGAIDYWDRRDKKAVLQTIFESKSCKKCGLLKTKFHVLSMVNYED